ncbi:MAG: glutamine synthetase family protein [Cocleimonas sp.]
MPGKLDLKKLHALAKIGEVDTVLAVQVDMQGRLMGKRFHVDFFLNSACNGTHACNYLLATDIEMSPVQGYNSTSWKQGYGDYEMKPDLDTLRVIPWLQRTALVICDVYMHTADHKLVEVPHSPRAILKKQLARLQKMGITPMMATELEFHIFKDSYETAHKKSYRDLDLISHYNEDYHIFQTTKEENIMRAIRNGLNGADIPVENSKGEADPGQAEVNVKYAESLLTADRHSIMKNGIKEIAWLSDQSVCFMAKWHQDAAGNSSHIHQSMVNEKNEPLFYDKNAQYGFSDLGRNYLSGLLQYTADFTFFLAPNINSYKRFSEGTFAPTKTVWSVDNRTAGYRICAPGNKNVRIECRIGGADLNPYLAMAACVAAGIKGMEAEYDLPEEFSGDAYSAVGVQKVPATLRDATAALDNSKMLREAFGTDVIDHYVHAARWEQNCYDKSVTDWERERGFERS